ncbi:MAG: protein kinase [Gemmatimonadota bacterium]
MSFTLPHSIAHYTLTQRLGEGGMGVVYRARDERLGREVALKMISGLSDEEALKRFWREARAAASVSHPNVCQIFEVSESPDGVYLAMELLAGEALDVRLQRAVCAPRDAVQIAAQMLAALGALHAQGLVHRDVKPSNVFLTPHGVKLLDFGLARPISDVTVRMDVPVSDQITRPGTLVGTPRYMAPEQVTGRSVDHRTDLYAVGAVLFEMLTGRPPFAGDNIFDLAAAILNDHPPALQGPASVVAMDRVIRRALAKDPMGRFPSADAMAAELRQVPVAGDTATSVIAVRALLRVVVPPLRLPGEDKDAAFLSFGLAEAVSASLAGLRDLVVRSPSLASAWTGGDADPRRLARDADVDVVVSGSLARMGDQLRATLQVIEAASGTVVGATSVRGQLSEIFEFEDQITKAVIALLTPLRADTGKSQDVHRDVPANARAFELFLRGLELARQMNQLPEARVYFQQALEHDPAFAPAWAWLGRCHRVIGKYIEDFEANDRRADDAFRRALALSPDLPIAHRFYTHYESEHGRADAAVARLLQHTKANRNDAQLFAALVHATRYAGLLGASVAAHEEARRLDPAVPTSVEFTYLALDDQPRLKDLALRAASDSAKGAYAYMLLFHGRHDEMRQLLAQTDLRHLPHGYQGIIRALEKPLSDAQGTLTALDEALTVGASNDPEAVFLYGMVAAALQAHDRGLESVIKAVQRGFTPVRTMETAPALAPVRQRMAFADALEVVRRRQRIALAVFERGDGPSLLGISADRAV